MSLVVPIEDIIDNKGLLSTASHWERIPLGDVTKILNGFPLKSTSFSKENGFPVIRIRDLKFNKIQTYYSGNFPKEFIVDTGDLLIGMDGDFICYEWGGGKAVLNQRVCKLIPDENFLLKKFLFYGINGYLSAIQKATSSVTVAHLSSLDVLRIPFPLPPLPEQHRIVAKLDALMERVERNKQRLDKIPALLKRFRQSVLAAAVSGRLTEGWRAKHPDVESAGHLLANLHRNRIKIYEWQCAQAIENGDRKPQFPRGLNESINYAIDEEFDIPLSWKWTVLDKISTVSLGGTPSRKIPEYWNGEIHWVSSGEVANNIINNTNEKISKIGFENSNAKLYPIGTVLMAMIGEGKTRGQVSILNIEACTNQNVAGLLINQDFLVERFIWFFLLSRYDQLRNNGLGGAQPALNGERVGQITICIPPLAEQHEIVRRVEQLFAFADKIEARYAKAKAMLDRLPQSILAKAFRGELVPQDPEDEPAGVLLERVRRDRGNTGRNKKKRDM